MLDVLMSWTVIFEYCIISSGLIIYTCSVFQHSVKMIADTKFCLSSQPGHQNHGWSCMMFVLFLTLRWKDFTFMIQIFLFITSIILWASYAQWSMQTYNPVVHHSHGIRISVCIMFYCLLIKKKKIFFFYNFSLVFYLAFQDNYRQPWASLFFSTDFL